MSALAEARPAWRIVFRSSEETASSVKAWAVPAFMMMSTAVSATAQDAVNSDRIRNRAISFFISAKPHFHLFRYQDDTPLTLNEVKEPRQLFHRRTGISGNPGRKRGREDPAGRKPFVS